MDSFEDLFRNSEISKRMGDILHSYHGQKITLMEVCGTHTMAIFKYGIKNLLPSSIKLVSGPGCPVCVTPGNFIKSAIDLSEKDDVIVTTFGDMMRVPFEGNTLLDQKANGRDVRIVYSPLDSLEIAKKSPDKKVVFLSIGFETTTPVCALAVLKADEMNLNNFFVLTANKTIPNVLGILAADKDLEIDGFIYPGHVSAINGNEFYRDIASKYHIPGVVTGFEPMDILHSIISLINMVIQKKYDVLNEYSRAVKEEGNPIAHAKVNQVFEPCDSSWRGLGVIKNSGLKLKEEYARFDAFKHFELRETVVEEPVGCLCGEVLKGKNVPTDCMLFGKKCTPQNPVGACMVSSEGTCSAYFKYGQ